MPLELPVVGSKIWRSAVYTTNWLKFDPPTQEHVCTVVEPLFVKDEKTNLYVFRAVSGVLSTKLDGGKVYSVSTWLETGIVCFWGGKIPDGWTYFEVTRHTKKGTGLWVKPVVGPIQELVDLATEDGGPYNRVVLPEEFGRRKEPAPKRKKRSQKRTTHAERR